MKYDKAYVFSAVDAEELHPGDLLICADTIDGLKAAVANNTLTRLKCVREESVRFRFSLVDDHICEYAYFVCPARNVDAYLAWEDGKHIEESVDNRKTFHDLVGEPKWFAHDYRLKKSIRPFKNCNELIDCFKHAHCYKDNEYIMPAIWVKEKGKENPDKYLITKFGDGKVRLSNNTYTLSELLEYFVFLDDIICGVDESA